ncbi:hypothetical protein KFL_009820010 [Klebsormidium nitens]|uniref:Uncharacterized protein n=1 Tax=Klebsormidium nitens TaxID=105231 RepID=A0A1Y1IN64_KLENI|nr:hypothetical protein KFL_009820010 [Klebsormidium nitens]|eukprot:GAQ92330.1 hypothetical protein KFL_009820010 [Klebsormidium nitens]
MPPKKPPDVALHHECLAYVSKLFKEPRTREDVKLRALRNKETECTVVKTSLSSFCKDAARALPLESVLKEVNKAIFEAYVLANLHVLRMCESGREVPLLDQPFFYNCLSAVSMAGRQKSSVKDLYLRETVELYLASRPASYLPPDCEHLSSGWYQNASLQMATCTRNSVATNFYKRFKRYLKHKYSLDGPSCYSKMRDMFADEYEGDDPLVLSLLPTKRGFECNHLKMCTNGLYGLLKKGGVELPASGAEFRKVADDYWRDLFDIAKFETCNRKFAGEILTDGKAVCIVLRKPKPKQASGEATLPDLTGEEELWGLDPGRRDLFVMVNEEGEKLKCSTREFYGDAKYKHSNAKIKRWYDKSLEVLEAIRNMPTKKTSESTKFLAYVHFVLPRLDMLLVYHMRQGFRGLKFKRYISVQKKLHALCNAITRRVGCKTVVGFGDWSNKDSGGIIKGSPSGPVKRLERELRKHCRVVTMDEFRTSKLHFDCKTQLRNQYSEKRCKDGAVKTFKVHSVLHCINSGCHGMTVNRDVNAARNILRLLRLRLEGRTRPVEFCRSVKPSNHPPPVETPANPGWQLGSRFGAWMKLVFKIIYMIMVFSCNVNGTVEFLASRGADITSYM